MTPEISHRCPACGVSIRDFGERALFCPECGRPLVTEESHEASIVTEESPETNEIHAQPIVSRAEDTAAESAAAADVGNAQPQGDELPKDETPKLGTDEVARPTRDPSKAPRHGARARTRETLHRASNVARGAIEDSVRRVENVHHVWSRLPQEAQYAARQRVDHVPCGLLLV